MKVIIILLSALVIMFFLDRYKMEKKIKDDADCRNLYKNVPTNKKPKD